MPDRSLINLNRLNLFVAQMQTGFGAFLAVYLTTQGWTDTDIGLALSVGTIAAMAAQLPSGAVVDAITSKRLATGGAILAIILAAMLVGTWPRTLPVLFAEAVQGAASCGLTLSIAALTLQLARFDALGERLGHNVRFAAIGSVLAATVMGALGNWVSHRAIYWLAAACGLAAIAALRGIHPADMAPEASGSDHITTLPPHVRKATEERRAVVLRRPALLVFAGSMALFQLGNAAMLPIAANAIIRTHAEGADLVVAACVIVPQLLAAWLSPAMGRAAGRFGRRPILLIGLAAMPLRALLFAFDGSPYLVIAFQALDGISSAVIGMIVPLIVADITRRHGRFNLAMGMIGFAVGIGATISTGLAGSIADHLGQRSAFAILAAAGLAACALAWLKLPETAPRS